MYQNFEFPSLLFFFKHSLPSSGRLLNSFLKFSVYLYIFGVSHPKKRMTSLTLLYPPTQ